MTSIPFKFLDKQIDFGERCLVMGVLNVTPDSFSDGGEFYRVRQAVEHGCEMAAAGADILDVGGESTRPGAPQVPAGEEISRVVPVIRKLRTKVDIPISIDTTKAPVAQAAIEAGASIVNDVSGLERDPALAEVLRETRAGCILMHMRGTPETMNAMTDYDHLVNEVWGALADLLEDAMMHTGLPAEHFMLDPGIGFAKTPEQNLDLIAAIPAFHSLNRPILMGPSRKSFIGHLLNQPDAHKRVWGTAGAVAACSLFGANVVRVHDVREMREVTIVADAIRARLNGGMFSSES